MIKIQKISKFMSTLQTIEYLKIHTLEQLYNDHGIKYRIDSQRTKFCLNYDQLKVTSGDPIGNECRGLILRPDSIIMSGAIPDDINLDTFVPGHCHVISRPMSRFYNMGDHFAATLNEDITVVEKLDGTMCTLYYDFLKKKWCVSTRSVPEADLPIRIGDIVLDDKTFADLFWEAFNVTIGNVAGLSEISDVLNMLDSRNTYVFELTTPQNRVVVAYQDQRITLIAVRDTQTGVESNIFSDSKIKTLPFHFPKTWGLLNPHAAAALADQFKPEELEGFVILDSRFNRVKVKNSSWVLSSRCKDGVISSKRNALLACLNGSIDDIISIVDPKTQSFLIELQQGVKHFLDKQEQKYREIVSQVDPSDHKYFSSLVTNAAAAGEIPITGPFYLTFRGKCTNIRDYYVNSAVNNKLNTRTLDNIIIHAIGNHGRP